MSAPETMPPLPTGAVLVTGTGGFLGGVVTAELARGGVSVVRATRKPTAGAVLVESGT